MKARRRGTSRIMTAIAVVLVVVLVLVSYDLGRSEGVATSYVTTTVYRNVELTGTCTAVSYIIPDTEEV